MASHEDMPECWPTEMHGFSTINKWPFRAPWWHHGDVLKTFWSRWDLFFMNFILVQWRGHMNMFLTFWGWLISLSIISSKFIQSVAGVESHSFLKLNNTVWRDHILFIHSSINRYLGCFHVWLLWVMLLWTWGCTYLSESLLSILLNTYSEVELLDLTVIPCSIF